MDRAARRRLGGTPPPLPFGHHEKVGRGHQRRPGKDQEALSRLQAPERPEPQQRQDRENVAAPWAPVSRNDAGVKE